MNPKFNTIIDAYESNSTFINTILLKKHAPGVNICSADKRLIKEFKADADHDALLANVIDAACYYAYFHRESFVFVVNFISRIFTSVMADEILSHINSKAGGTLYEKKIEPYVDDYDSFGVASRLSVFYLVSQCVTAFEVLPSIPFLRMHEIFTTLGESHDDLNTFYQDGGRVQRILFGVDECEESDEDDLDFPFDIDEDDFEFRLHTIEVSFGCDDEITRESVLESVERFNGVIGDNKGGKQVVKFSRMRDAYGFIELCSIFDIDAQFTREE